MKRFLTIACFTIIFISSYHFYRWYRQNTIEDKSISGSSQYFSDSDKNVSELYIKEEHRRICLEKLQNFILKAQEYVTSETKPEKTFVSQLQENIGKDYIAENCRVGPILIVLDAEKNNDFTFFGLKEQ